MNERPARRMGSDERQSSDIAGSQVRKSSMTSSRKSSMGSNYWGEDNVVRPNDNAAVLDFQENAVEAASSPATTTTANANAATTQKQRRGRKQKQCVDDSEADGRCKGKPSTASTHLLFSLPCTTTDLLYQHNGNGKKKKATLREMAMTTFVVVPNASATCLPCCTIQTAHPSFWLVPVGLSVSLSHYR